MTVQEESIEKQLWKTADKLRKNIDAAEYKHFVLGLNNLEYISTERLQERITNWGPLGQNWILFNSRDIISEL